MAFGIYALLVICIVINISKSQNTAKKTNLNHEAQLSEVNVRMHALQRTMDSFVTDNHKLMESFVTDNQKQIEELKDDLNEKLINISKTQNTAIQTTMKLEAELSATNTRMQALQQSMDSFVTDNQKQMDSFVTNNRKQIEELKDDLNTKVINISQTQNTAILTTMKFEAQLSDMNTRMQALEQSMNSFVTDNQKQTEELKSAFNTKFNFVPEIENNLEDVQIKLGELKLNCVQNDSSKYTFHHSVKSWTDADLSCKAEGRHLVSFETVAEQRHAFRLTRMYTSCQYWTSAKDLGRDNWIWENSREKVLDDLWNKSPKEPSGDGDCAHMNKGLKGSPLNDTPCPAKLCYICESN